MTAEDGEKQEAGSTEATGIDRMYQIYEKLNSAEDKASLESEYRQFMDAAHRSEKEKRLASPFITRFIEFFPDMYEEAIDAMLDLCEEEDTVIRKQVVKDLISACKKMESKSTKRCVPKIADVFCQLIQIADTTESQALDTHFLSLFNIDAKGTLAGIFAQIRDGEEVVRDASLKMLVSKVKELNSEVSTLQFQRCLYGEIKGSIKCLSDDEFKTVLDLLSNKFLRQADGERQVMELCYDRIFLTEPLNTEEPSTIESLLTVTDRALALLSATVEPNPLILYYFTKVLPHIGRMGSDGERAALQLETLKRLAELLLHLKAMEESDAVTCLDAAFQLAFELIPPADSESSVNFSLIECSLFFLYQLGSVVPTHMTSSERLVDLRSRLAVLHRPTVSYKEKLRQAFKNHEAKPLDLTELENKKKVIALKVLKNLNSLIKAILEEEIKYGQKIQLSWKPLTQPHPAPSLKRSISTLSAHHVAGAKNMRGGAKDRELQRYQPPGGKYSRGGAFGTYGGGGRGGFPKPGFGRGRGTFRGNSRRF